MAVIGQSHLLWKNRVPDHISHRATSIGTMVRTIVATIVVRFVL